MKKRKIQLHRETLRNLESTEVALAAGGTAANSNCGSACLSNCRTVVCTVCHNC
jgi:hypothetical protein